MKKFLSLAVVAGFLLFLGEGFAQTSSQYSSSYWPMWLQKYIKTSPRYRPSAYNFRRDTWSPSYYRNRSTTRTTNPSASASASSQYTYPRTSTSRVYRSPSRYTPSSRRRVSSNALRITATPIRQSRPVSIIDGTEIPVFSLGVRNSSTTRSTELSEALNLTEMTFQVFSNSGIASDPTNFALVVNGEDFQVERDGNVTLRFQNARVARNQTLELQVGLKVEDPTTTPNINGSLRVRLLQAKAYTESSRREITPSIAGSPISDFISFNPTPVTSGTPAFSGRTDTRIFSQTLGAGEKAFVLALRFAANYDDMLLENITVRDTLSGGGIDSFVKNICAVDLDANRQLGCSRFIGGEADFRFYRAVRIDRNEDIRIGFEVQIADRVQTSTTNTQFELDVLPSDIDIRGLGSGKDVPDSNKTISLEKDTFFVTNSGGGSGSGGLALSTAGSQPRLTTTGSLEPVYRFRVSNGGRRDLFLGRISMNINVNGVEFPGGISTDDFQIRRVHDGYEVGGTDFSVSLGGGNKVIFDTNNQVLVSRGSQIDFVLKMRLEDIPGVNSRDDYVAVQFLRDSSLSSGTLANVRAAGANFIWSDDSESPHSTTSTDWFSGYLLRGIPSEYQINYRR